jgi:hypothetical protein
MVVGVVLGEFAPSVRSALNTAKFNGVSIRTQFLNFNDDNVKLYKKYHYSHCHWLDSYDVACSNQSPI